MASVDPLRLFYSLIFLRSKMIEESPPHFGVRVVGMKKTMGSGFSLDWGAPHYQRDFWRGPAVEIQDPLTLKELYIYIYIY